MKTQVFLLTFTFSSIRALLPVVLSLLLALPVISYGSPVSGATKESKTPAVAEHTIKSVNINSADAQALSKVLKGVGKKKALAIIDWRKKHGPFTNINQLLEVKGIGDKVLANNRNKIKL